MLDLILFLVKLPFVLIGAVASLLSSVSGAVLGIVGALLSGLWTLVVWTLLVLLVVWLVVALLRRRRSRMA